MIVIGKGKAVDVRNEYELFHHYCILAGEMPQKVETVGNGLMKLTEKNGNEIIGKISDVTRQIRATHGFFRVEK